MKDKYGLLLGFGISALALFTLMLWMANAGSLEPMEIMAMVLVLLVIAGATIILIQKSKAVRAGLPVEDELARQVAWKAGYFAYIFTVWLAVALLWYNSFFVDNFGLPHLDSGEVIALIVLLPGAVFLGMSLYLNKKGDL